MPVEALRALVVGTGFGCRIQVPAFRGAGYDVVGLVGSDPARTAERAAANGIAEHFTDLGEAIEATRPDVVAISTTPHTHGPLTLQAIEAGCHVLCEKPFARDASEARAMLDAAEKAGKVHMLGNEFRYTEQRSTTTRLISDGALGEPRFASFVQVGDFIRAWQDDFPDWWFDPAQGGGWLGASSSHWIDQIRVWLGEFDSLSATLNAVTLSRGPVEDTFTLRFTMQSGLEGVLQQCAGAYGPMFEFEPHRGQQGPPVVRFRRRPHRRRQWRARRTCPRRPPTPPAPTAHGGPAQPADRLAIDGLRRNRTLHRTLQIDGRRDPGRESPLPRPARDFRRRSGAHAGARRDPHFGAQRWGAGAGGGDVRGVPGTRYSVSPRQRRGQMPR